MRSAIQINFGDVRILPKIWDRLSPEPNSGCWLWLGKRNVQGYGCVRVGKKIWYVHRYTFTQTVSAIAPGLQLDHLCRNTICANPMHLEMVTGAENMRRRPDLNLDVCGFGHPYDSKNTYIRPDTGIRQCKACGVARRRAARHLARQAKASL